MKISYLFGAGASKNSLPIINEIPDRIRGIVDYLKIDDEKFYSDPWTELRFQYSKRELLDFFISDLKWLLENTLSHASVDTFAKKLFIKDKGQELRKLKVLLSAFFVLEQARNPYDKRYDTFYASILNETYSSFPNNVRILSWNYDYQFERALAEYSDQFSLKPNQDYLNVISKHSFRRLNRDQFAIIKLNGTCNFLDLNRRNQHDFCSSFENCISTKLINEVLENYAILLHSDWKLHCGLSFAWETHDLSEINIVERAISETNDTEVLVVIGYSFPYFNREIDRRIINQMGSLKRVYFQSPEPEILKERFLSILPDFSPKNMFSRFDVNQFLLPNEL